MPLILGFAGDSIQLVPDGTLVLHVIIILIMVYVLNATLYKPINNILASREKRTRGRLTEAQEIMQNVTAKVNEYEQSLRQARAEAYAFTEAQRTEAMKDRQARLNEMRGQLAEVLAQEKKTIEAQSTAARTTLESDARRIASEIGARVLKRPISESLN